MPGSNPVMMGTTAVVDGDDYVINGQKWFTSSADGAAFAIVMAVTEPRRAAIPAGQHDHRSDRHSRFQPGPQRERDGPRRIRACEPCRGHLRVVPGATIAPARRRGQRLRDRPGAARPGTHPPLHALAGHRRPIVRSHVRSSERTADHSRRRDARRPTGRSALGGRARRRDPRRPTADPARGVDDRPRTAPRPPATRSRRSSSPSPTRCSKRSTPRSRCTARSASPMTPSCRTGTDTNGPPASTTAPTRSTRRRSAAASCDDTGRNACRHTRDPRPW